MAVQSRDGSVNTSSPPSPRKPTMYSNAARPSRLERDSTPEESRSGIRRERSPSASASRPAPTTAGSAVSSSTRQRSPSASRPAPTTAGSAVFSSTGQRSPSPASLQSSFCDECWAGQFSHKKGKVSHGGVPHENTRPTIAEKVRNALEPPADGTVRERLCADDQFADLMASTDPKKRATSTRFIGSSDTDRGTRTPSLVSFVGQTGAGKSTLIKLIIDLASDANLSYEFETPVIGGRGAHVPTSEDVHLYIDPRTWDGQAPILFTDCERLEGGEREPLGARLKRKRKNGKSSGDDSAGGGFQKAVKIISERELNWAQSNRAGREFAVANLYPRLLFTVVEHVFERLVNWANAAIETSINQPLLPHAIILWDVNINTSTILDDLAKTVNQNSLFKKYADTWRQRGKTVDTLEQLVLCYYGSIQILRVPEEDRPRLMQDQVANLYHGILTASIAARNNKARLCMLLDVEDLQAYLEHALSHFSGTLDFPFDFVQASFINSPIPPDFGGNILKLAINIMDVWKGEADGAEIFQALSYMVASCIMIETTRNNKPGAADQVFPQYFEHIDAALENFCEQHWPCEFMLPGANQSKDGKIIAAGIFESSFKYARYLKEFRDSIHRDKVVQRFYRHVSNGASVPDEFESHTLCLCCLFEAPEHPLPCGHVLSMPCVKLYGYSHGPNEIDMYNCHLEGNAVRHTWTIRLKPKTAGVRILTLDGGGMRGVVELEILRALEQAMNIQIPIQSFFDLIVGTSTGGLISIGLGVMNWVVDESIDHFERMVTRAFTRRTGSSLWGVGFFVDNFNHSRYETKPLEQCLMEAYSKDQYLFGGRHQASAANAGSTVKVAITATSLNGRAAIVLGNYNRVCSDKLSYQFLPACATSAAPKFFKPYNHEPTQRSYIDGAVFHNNPIELAERERKLIWPELQDSYPDIVVSLGTATSPSLKRAESSRFIRVNPELANEAPSLDDVKAMPDLQKDIRNRLKHDPTIRNLAFELLATSFYFELLGPIGKAEMGGGIAEGKFSAPGRSFTNHAEDESSAD
ncbi:hypothetical protein EJ08DRAFT_690440 [Tothia fuscella]|uniref:PNPLA domain-containing protein n=1 Tax=Tothia fuscella TaxID=1048955 RepID=A0A9P4NG13_9PEZI|nr:hypothetical protein EJ08DRAFT_690440 [Tothia fuscella]